MNLLSQSKFSKLVSSNQIFRYTESLVTIPGFKEVRLTDLEAVDQSEDEDGDEVKDEDQVEDEDV